MQHDDHVLIFYLWQSYEYNDHVWVWRNWLINKRIKECEKWLSDLNAFGVWQVEQLKR